MNPMIYSVYCVYPDPEATSGSVHFLDVHFVVGKNSQDAERTILRSDGQFLRGRRFIVTDGRMEENPRETIMFATSYTNGVFRNAQEMRQWIVTMTSSHDDSGTTRAAALREF